MEIDWNSPGTWLVAGGLCFAAFMAFACVMAVWENVLEGQKLRQREREMNELMKPD
jgi:hypothetical protein